ncbi:hypothetical protein HNQ94_000248 [Salirhabdus euzebyi]|uniref:Uncharacterized protein n=1 Tax=Salirhabdus euzebyi TaxID=394506 RepID=A0A841PSA7_9BACI|nr:DUF6583 family protein [Salirhabdus euzebyi]MBB6451827.1 hypothetical protein [Salirhabdus euzebyi]
MDQNQRGNKKGLIWIVSIILVFGIGAIGVFAYNQLVTKNPMVQYVNAEKNTFEEAWDYYDEYYGDSKVLSERLLKEAYESSSTFTADTQLPAQLGQSDPMIGMVQGIVSSISLNTETKVKPSTKEFYAGVDLSLQGSSLLDGNVYQNEEITSFQVPALYDKYFVLENNGLGDYLRQAGAYEVPFEEIPNIIELQQETLTAEQLKEMVREYLTFLKDYVSEEKVNVEDNVKYEGESFTKLSVNFTEAEAQQLIKDLLTKIRDDERFQSQFGDTELQKEEINYLIDNVNLLKLPNGITYEAYMDGDYVSYRTLSFDITDEMEQDSVTFSLNINTLIQSGDKYTFDLALHVVPQTEEGELSISYSENGAPNSGAYNVKQSLGFLYFDEWSDVDFAVNADTNYKDNTLESTFDVVINSPYTQDIPEISGFIKSNVSNGSSSAEKGFEFGIDLAMMDPMMGDMNFNFTIYGDTAINFADNLEFPAVAENNSVYVFDLTPQELEQIMYEIEMNAMTYYQSFFGGFGGF